MEKCTELFKRHLNGKRNWTKTMFKIAGTIYRGANNNRFTVENALNALDRWEA